MSFEQQLGNPVQWNIVHPDNVNSIFKPVTKYDREQIIRRYDDENSIQKPSNTINRFTDERHGNSPKLTTPYHVPGETYVFRPAPTYFRSPVEEYLLHAEMALPNGRTYVLANKAARAETESLT